MNQHTDNAKRHHEITEAVVQAARENPNGWVYKIDGQFGPQDAVPPHAIVGAWKVNAQGNLTGEFIDNPNYRPAGPQNSGG
jgi:hypothetical protein